MIRKYNITLTTVFLDLIIHFNMHTTIGELVFYFVYFIN